MIKRKAVGAVMLLSAVLWGVSLWQGEKISQYGKDVQIRYQGQGVSRQTVEQMRETGLRPEEKNFPETAAWNVEYCVEARNPILEFKQEVTCITVCGAMDQIIKDRLVAGTYGYADDEEGCVISSKTAWELFGATNVTGQWISVKGKRFLIRGVTAGSYPMVILAAKRLEPPYFSNVSFSYEEGTGGEGMTEELMVRFGFPRQEFRINGSFYSAAVRLAQMFPGWALLFCFCLLLRQKGGRRRSLYFLIICGNSIFLIWYGFHFPGEFIPSRWSDFSFYGEKFRQVKENMFEIAMLPKNRWDVELTQAFAIAMLSAAESAVLMITTGSLLYIAPKAE